MKILAGIFYIAALSFLVIAFIFFLLMLGTIIFDTWQWLFIAEYVMSLKATIVFGVTSFVSYIVSSICGSLASMCED